MSYKSIMQPGPPSRESSSPGAVSLCCAPAGRQSLGNGVVRPKPSGLVASPSWARPFVVAGGSTCALYRALVQAGIEAKSARAVSSLLVRTAGDGGCSAPAATRGGRRPLFCGGEPRSSKAHHYQHCVSQSFHFAVLLRG